MVGIDLISLKEQIVNVSQPIFAVRENGQLVFTQEYPSTPIAAYVPGLKPDALGSQTFRARHGLRFPYVAGAMANGIASPDMVKAMAGQGMIGFLGAGGLSLDQIEKHIIELKQTLGEQPFGFNLIHSPFASDHEMATVKLYLKYGIKRISAAAFMRITPALVYYRVKGIHQDAASQIIVPNQVVAKVSRVEIARQFFSPPPEKILGWLVEQGLITQQEAQLAAHIPMAQDLTAEADSGGHTDNRPALAPTADHDGSEKSVYGAVQVQRTALCGPWRWYCNARICCGCLWHGCCLRSDRLH